MKLAYKLFLIFFALLLSAPLQAAMPAGIDTLEVSMGFEISKQSTPPFFMQTNREGRISESSRSIFTRLRINKHNDEDNTFDWMYGLDVTSRSNNSLTRTNDSRDLVLTEAYTGLTWKNFRITLGRKTEFFGLADTLLTLGSEVYSNNAPNIPKIALSTNGYVGITDELAFNAYLAHGWMGDEQNVSGAYLHEKFLYIRFGQADPDEGFNFYAGIHHLAVWGGTDRTTGFHYPSDLSAFKDIFFGLAGGSNSATVDQTNALGNHLGSLEYALRIKGFERDWFMYAQTLFEDGSGLWGGGLQKPGDYFLGISLINKQKDSIVKRINFEYLDTGGPVIGDPDDYFAHYQYGSGWTYEGYGIGTPFISFIPGPDYRWYPQSRVKGANAGIALSFSDLVNPTIRVAWIRQQGSILEPLPGINRFAFALFNTSTIDNGWRINQEFYFDAGESIKLNPGILFSLTRSLF